MRERQADVVQALHQPPARVVIDPERFNQAVVGTAVPTLYGYLFELNTTTVPNGTYTLQSVASDAGGNAGFSSGVQITIAN